MKLDGSELRSFIASVSHGSTFDMAMTVVKSKDQEVVVQQQAVKKSGRKPTKVNLKTTSNTKLVRHIIRQMAPNSDAFNDVDWDDLKSVTKAWDTFIAIMEQNNYED